MIRPLFLLTLTLITLLTSLDAGAQAFFRRKDKFRRSYMSRAITTPVLSKPVDKHSSPEAQATTPIESESTAGVSRQDIRRQRREERKAQRKSAKIDRQYALAKGIQERSFLGDAIVEHSYREETEVR